jgi:alanine racemase
VTRRIDRSLERAGLPPLDRSAWVEVHIDVLTRNGRALEGLARPAALGAVVKADGYGHGLEMAARCAIAGGATWLCVADSAEARRLRTDGYEGRILVLYPVPATVMSTMARLGVDLTVGSLDAALAIDRLLLPGDPSLAVHLEVDTGMTRGGVAPGDAGDAAAAIAVSSATLAGVWTHLAAPEDATVTALQIERLRDALGRVGENGLDPGVVHVCASGGLLAVGPDGQSLVRPGLAFYGLHPGAGGPLPEAVAPALAVRAHPVRLATVEAGTAVGYAGTWVAETTSTVATLPIGYADGWSRSSSPGAEVLVEGRRAPVVGRVSSDSLTADVTGIPGIGPDSEFTLLGSDGDDEITADEVAANRRTISWEVLQQLSGRLARVYLSGSTPIAVRAESTTEIVLAPGAAIPWGRDPLVDDGPPT